MSGLVRTAGGFGEAGRAEGGGSARRSWRSGWPERLLLLSLLQAAVAEMGRLRGMLLCLLLAAAVSTAPSPTPTASSTPTEPSPASTEPSPASTETSPAFNYPQEEATLNEMFREVEELMEDTQHKLRSAVEEVGEPAHQTPVSGGCGGAGQGGWGFFGVHCWRQHWRFQSPQHSALWRTELDLSLS